MFRVAASSGVRRRNAPVCPYVSIDALRGIYLTRRPEPRLLFDMCVCGLQVPVKLFFFYFNNK